MINLETIRKGRATLDMLPEIFDSEDVPEEMRLKALAQLMRLHPKAVRPYFKRIRTIQLADAINTHKVEPDLISLALRAFSESTEIRSAALESPRTPGQAMLLMAQKLTESQVGSLMRDEFRLILSPDLLGALIARDDLDELVVAKLKDIQVMAKKEAQMQIRHQMRPENMSAEDRGLMVIEDEGEPDKKKSQNIYSRLMTMTAAEKAMLAIHANRMTRMILVRDPNTMVSKAVMSGPRITENDIETIAQTREVSEEVLRIVANNKRWLRKYVIMKNLALNPRTPVAIALNLLPKLSNLDVKNATRDFNLASPVRQAVIRLAEKRGMR